jgi:predicted RNase H-like nuclease (RuvC/YqgF family)
MLNIRRHLVILAALASLAGCASTDEKTDTPVSTPVVEAIPSNYHSPADLLKISDLERQITREQRQYFAEKRRLEISLKESQKLNEELQKKIDDLQKKLDALLAIDRDLRNRSSRMH